MSKAPTSTKTSRVVEELGQRLRSGEWAADNSLPSLSALSDEYQVSAGTVALALKSLERDGLVKVLPRQGVVATGEGIVTVPIGGIPTIAICSKKAMSHITPDGGYHDALSSSIISYATERGGVVSVIPLPEEGPSVIIERCRQLGVQGIVFQGGTHRDLVRCLQNVGFPAITSNMPLGPNAVNYCSYDHKFSIIEGVRLLTDLGHRRIGFLSFETSTPGLIEANKPDMLFQLCKRGALYDINEYWRNVGPLDAEDRGLRVRMAMDELFALQTPPTAIYCRSLLTEEILGWAEERGISIPGDLSIIADGCPSQGSMVSGFTYDNGELSAHLVESLYAIIGNPYLTIQKSIPMNYVDRGSVGAVQTL